MDYIEVKYKSHKIINIKWSYIIVIHYRSSFTSIVVSRITSCLYHGWNNSNTFGHCSCNDLTECYKRTTCGLN